MAEENTPNDPAPADPPADPSADAPNDPPADPAGDPKPEGDPPADPAAEEPSDSPADPDPEPSDPPVAEWRESITDADLKKQAEQYNSVEDILRHARTMRQRLSKALVLPGEDATDEDLKEFRQKLGVPEEPAKYSYDMPEDLPDFIKESVSDQELADIKEVAHGLGLTQAQLKGIMDYRLNALAEADEAYAEKLKERRAKAEGDLKREWGREYEANTNLARRALQNFADDGMMDWLAKTVVEGEQLANHPHIIRWAASVGRRMQEGNIHMEHDANTAQTMTEKHEDLTRRIHEARANNDFKTAKRLDRERSQLSAELDGTQPIVGTMGRVA